MITLSHSEAFVYDLLSIACIKVEHNPYNTAANENVTQLVQQIVTQIGTTLHYDILNSSVYYRLYDVNNKMYKRIDEMKTRDTTGEDARYIDNLVYERFIMKKALQEKWFPGQPLTETKHGYSTVQEKY